MRDGAETLKMALMDGKSSCIKSMDAAAFALPISSGSDRTFPGLLRLNGQQILIGLSDVFAGDATKQLQWQAFLRKNKLEPMDLGEVVRTIRERTRQFGFAGT